MTRLPCEGRNKTRLIPALGSMGATAFHERLARHATGRAWSYALMHPGTKVQVQLEGGSAVDGQTWLGEIDCRVQKDGDLGHRLRAAVEQAFSEGACRVLVLGTDCPSLDEPLLAEAFDSLNRADLVFGPAADGGYYLVGLTKSRPEIFQNIDWGGPQVLTQSLAAAATCGVNASLLEVRPDVDVPDDLPAAYAVLAEGSTLSAIVPTLNEQDRLPKLLERLKQASPHEIIISDGGSTDRPVEITKQSGARVIHISPGRASQMNLAAGMATREFLLFLHADTMPHRIIRRSSIGFCNRPEPAPGRSASHLRAIFQQPR